MEKYNMSLKENDVYIENHHNLLEDYFITNDTGEYGAFKDNVESKFMQWLDDHSEIQLLNLIEKIKHDKVK